MTATRQSHFTFRPRSALYGVFDDLSAVRDLSQRLLDGGFGDQQVQVLSGEDGARDLDPDGRHHGLFSRLLRALQSITDEREHLERYVRELFQGRHVVVVSTPNTAQGVRAICQAFKDCGGHYIHHYGPHVVEELSA